MENVANELQWLAVLLYLASTITAFSFLKTGRLLILKLTGFALVVGAILFLLSLLIHGITTRQLPLVGARDALLLLIILTTSVALWTARQVRTPSLLCFHAPILAVLSLISKFLMVPAQTPIAHSLASLPLLLHVVIAFGAYALLLSAGLTSAAYVLKARHLKKHDASGIFHYLPSLEQLEIVLWRLVLRGYVLFGMTLVIGLIWAWTDRHLLGAHWYFAPKVILSFSLVIFYALCFHARRRNWLRAPQLAYLILMGFFIFFSIYIVLECTGLRTYNFWGGAG